MAGRVWGYARVSDKDQNLEKQLIELRKHIDDAYIKSDKASGKDFNRKQYNTLVGTPLSAPILDKDDILLITSLDRLGRNYKEIKEQWDYITNTLQADIKVLDMPLLDTSRKGSDDLDTRFIADLTLQILSYVAERERINIKTRQAQGINAMPIMNGKRISGKTGKPTGRPKAIYPPLWDDVYTQWIDKKITAKEAMSRLELTRCTFYNLVNRLNERER